MCTRFIYRGSDIVTAFNFDIDTDVWKHKIILEKRRFCIGILRPDGKYHSYHGVNANGNAGTLLYVHENPKAAYSPSPDCVVISDILEKYIKAELSFDDILGLLHTKRLVYAPDATMQAMLTDALGRALILEPGIGHREEAGRFSLMTNYSLLDPPKHPALYRSGRQPLRKGRSPSGKIRRRIHCIRRLPRPQSRKAGGRMGHKGLLRVFPRRKRRIFYRKQRF